MQRLCPELTALMNLFYTVDAVHFFAVDSVVEAILSAEGVRMGCPLRSFGFDLALQAELERRHAPCKHRREVAHRRLQPGRAAAQRAGWCRRRPAHCKKGVRSTGVERGVERGNVPLTDYRGGTSRERPRNVPRPTVPL